MVAQKKERKKDRKKERTARVENRNQEKLLTGKTRRRGCSVLLFFAGLILIHLSLVSLTTLKCCQLLRGGQCRGGEARQCKQKKTELLCSICSAFSFQAFPIVCVCVLSGKSALSYAAIFFISSISYNILCNIVALQRAHKNEMNCEK